MDLKRLQYLLVEGKDVWYSKGVRFKCLMCGKCCCIDNGYVEVTKNEANRISKHTGLAINEFTVVRGMLMYLKDKKDGCCVFHNKKKQCTIHKIRPFQCSSYPFWKENFKSKDTWNSQESYCPGINKGMLYSKKEIDLELSKEE